MVRSHRKAFTLVELLVVITIIAMLMALLIPAVQAARERARQTVCVNNLRQVGQAMISFDSSKDNLPGWLTMNTVTIGGDVYNVYSSWVPQIFTQLDRGDLYEVYKTDPRVFAPGTSLNQTLESLICPSDSQLDSSFPFSFAVNGGRPDLPYSGSGRGPGKLGKLPNNNVPADYRENGTFVNLSTNMKRLSLSDVTRGDGHATTLLLVENADVGGWHYVPETNTDPSANVDIFRTSEHHLAVIWDPYPAGGSTTPSTVKRFPPLSSPTWLPGPVPAPATSQVNASPRSEHPGQFNVVMCDGSTKSLSDDMEYGVYAQLATSDGSKAKNPHNGTDFVFGQAGTDWRNWPVVLNEASLAP